MPKRPREAEASSTTEQPPKKPSVRPPVSGLLVVGTYHSVMAGLVLRAENKFLLKFSVKHHVGCLNAVAASDKYIATGGTDEKLFLFTAKDKGGQVADLGSLAPASEVRALAWPSHQHLVCGCSDGTVGVYRTRDWENVLALNVHEKAVNALALHPSGALAVTLGSDKHIALLDMQAGKLVTRTRCPAEPLGIAFHPTGSLFAVYSDYEVFLYDTFTAELKSRMSVVKQPCNQLHCISFAMIEEKAVVLAGAENGSISVFRYNEQLELQEGHKLHVVEETLPQEIVQAQSHIKDETKKKHPMHHGTRVKSMLWVGDAALITADANGAVICWRLSHEGLLYRCSANCQGRVTAMSFIRRD